MANYDRQILVPYLQDVCSMEMLCQKLTREIAESQRRIRKLEVFTSQDVSYPSKPMEADYALDSSSIKKTIPFFALGVVIFGAGCFFKLPILGIIFGGMLVGCGVCTINDISFHNKKEYNDDIQWYEAKVHEIDETRNEIAQKRRILDAEKNELNRLKDELSKAKKLREDIYNVNIIPKRYRDVYSVYYLHDYFTTCRETDLDRIIRTMLLDEIRRQLNEIVVQNEEVILNQRLQLAMQEQSNLQLAENHREQMRRLASMESNQELQLDYQDMIAKNQEVTNFFLAADYLK